MAETRAERRLAAIMVADVVGYSRLVESDETNTLARLRALRSDVITPLIAEHHGRTVKLMGDGAIVEFSSVVDAVACAVAIQKEGAAHQAQVAAESRIIFRIGINLGDVVVEGDDLLGDGVNVAARLEQLCPPGGVLVSGTAYDHLHGKLDLPLDFAGEQQVKNISRPVRTYSVRMSEVKRHWRPRARRFRGWLLPGAAIVVVLFLAAGAYWFFWPADTTNAAPSIAVLPFENLSGEEATSRLVEGMTEDIITDLSRFRDLDVIARNSTERYKGKPVDLRQAGKDLNVRYVLGGSIQRQADQVRVTAELIDVTDGSRIWSERWDRPIEDVFAVQTEVAERVANTLGGYNLLLHESKIAAKRKRPSDLQAYDLYVLAYEADQQGTEESFKKGIEYADAAIGRDPSLARAYVQKGWLLFHLAAYRKNWDEAFAEMEQLARKAIDVDPNDAIGHALLAFTIAGPRSSEAAEAAARALALNPSSADVLNITADGMPFYGKAKEGAASCDRAFRLSPDPPVWYYADCVAPYFFSKRFEDAIEAVNRWRTINPLNPFVLVMMAGAQAELGRKADAARTVAEIEKRYPEISYEYLHNNLAWRFAREEDEQFVLAAIRKAGIRICGTEKELQPGSDRLPECTLTQPK